jgi:hypothetical protein
LFDTDDEVCPVGGTGLSVGLVEDGEPLQVLPLTGENVGLFLTGETADLGVP